VVNLTNVVVCPFEITYKGEIKYRLVIVREDRPGYIPSKYGYFPTLKEAWDKADEINKDMGILNREKVIEIVKSSFNIHETLYAQE
jgi:hypothetical protein